MSDIVTQLRNACTGKVTTTVWPHRLLHDAADEIEKCWENINIKADWIDATINDMAKMDQHVTTVEAENKRLKYALDVAMKKLAPDMPGDSRAVPDWFVACAAVQCGLDDDDGKVIDCLRAALEGE